MKNPVEEMMSASNKAVEFWTDLTNKTLANFKNATEPKPEPTGVQQIGEEWYKAQREFFEEAMKTQPQESLSKSPEMFQKWVAIQNDYSQKWLKAVQNSGENFVKWTKNGVAAADWWSQSNAWMQDLMGKTPSPMQSHLFNFQEMYNNLYKSWEPALGFIQNGIADPKLVEKYFQPEQFKQLLGTFMNMQPVGNVSEAMEKFKTWSDQLLKNSFNTFLPQATDFWKKVSQNPFTEQNAYFQWASELSKQVENHTGPYFNMLSGQGKPSEAAKIIREMQFAYLAFLVKSSEIQAKCTEAGQYVLPDLVAKHAETFKTSKKAPDFQAFFKEYVNELENRLSGVLTSDQYSDLQSEMATASVTLKAKFDELSELMLSDFPILLKKDGDDFALELSSLRQKIRALEAKIEALTAETSVKKKK
jgi:hypothetical protein